MLYCTHFDFCVVTSCASSACFQASYLIVFSSFLFYLHQWTWFAVWLRRCACVFRCVQAIGFCTAAVDGISCNGCFVSVCCCSVIAAEAVSLIFVIFSVSVHHLPCGPACRKPRYRLHAICLFKVSALNLGTKVLESSELVEVGHCHV